MAGFYGADVEQLRQLAETLERGAESLERTATALSGAVTRTRWPGPDGERFTHEWTAQHRAELLRVSARLSEASATVSRNAAAQETASAADGGVSGPGGGSSNPGTGGTGGGGDGVGDRPDNPDLTDGLGEYEDITDSIPMDDDAFDPTQISQGQVGDCWLLASLGAIAGFDEEFLQDHMWLNPDGTWTVKMYEDGEPVYIQVEPSVPAHGAQDADGNPSWISIYEKAAAEYFGGSYSDIDGDWPDRALEAITGQESHNLGEASFDEIREALEDGPVVATTENKDKTLWFFGDTVDDTDLVVPNHAYMVTDVYERTDADGNTETYVEMINPWGPNGGDDRYGTIVLTEEQYRDNFSRIYTGSTGD